MHHRSNVVKLKDGLTIAEVVQLLEDNTGENEDAEMQNIFIAPPAANELTDEDTEAVLSNNVRIGGNAYDFSEYSTRDREWTDGDLVDPIKKDTYFPKDCLDKYKNITPVETFELFIDEEVVTVFVRETKKYALSKNEGNINVSSEEMKAFLGILILSDDNVLPGKKYELPNNRKNHPYHIVTDNLFTSLNLLKHLRERGYSKTRTIRKNRIPKDCILPSHEQMKKMERRTFRDAIRKRDEIFIGKWMNNSVVAVESNSLGENPVKFVKRFSSKDRKHINVSQPAVMGTYNKNRRHRQNGPGHQSISYFYQRKQMVLGNFDVAFGCSYKQCLASI
ncbi:hypothetical protein ILUMI_12405 [Ignelater luminosus]|uniref:PiggyBac transposable element-derived protein domain-containing protein n=1 Tax=Ignelater luminosus TaxID=2038154 RepID=A0A8K0D0E1_IGNLU|nr:hypothetical protein ILUMI_12405 [Ignelater luminosus]